MSFDLWSSTPSWTQVHRSPSLGKLPSFLPFIYALFILYDWNLAIFQVPFPNSSESVWAPHLPSSSSSSLLWFSTLTSPHRYDWSHLHSLFSALTFLASVINSFTRWRTAVCFFLWRNGTGHAEVADMADSFVGYSAGGGKRMKAALTSKYALVNEKGG